MAESSHHCESDTMYLYLTCTVRDDTMSAIICLWSASITCLQHSKASCDCNVPIEKASTSNYNSRIIYLFLSTGFRKYTD
jgi:hypothetical protein